MAEGKWIEDLRPEMRLHQAAAKALQVRLEVVRDALPPALHEAENDPEHVHRLRVATRRADAALRIFQPNLPEKVFKAARRRLRRVRRAAGAARDWDVFLFELIDRRKNRPAVEHSGLDFLIGLACGQRAAAQPDLLQAATENGTDICPKEIARAIEAHDHEPTLLQLARPLLASLVHRLEEAVSGDLTDYAQLHQVRIAGKRLRYAMEVFAGCFASEFRVSVYPLVEEMQDILGRANDSHVAVGRLLAARQRLTAATPAEWKRLRSGVESVLRFHRLRLPRERRRFLAWWKRWETSASKTLARIVAADVSARASM
jgi:CHAD domain-containing protein